MRPVLSVLALVCLSAFAPAQKKPLDHSVYDGWNSIRGTTLSRDGVWIVFSIDPQEGDGTATIRNLNDGRTLSISRGTNLRFTKDSKFLVGTITPKFIETRDAKRKKAKSEDMPKPSLAIVDLGALQLTQVDKVTSYDLAKDDSDWLLYKPEAPKAEPPKPEAAKTEKPAETPKAETKSERKDGDPYVLRKLDTAKEERIQFVTGEAFNKTGTVLAYATSTKDGKGDGVTYYDLKSGLKTQVTTESVDYPKLALDPEGKWLAYLSQKDDGKDKPPTMGLHLFDAVSKKGEAIGADSLPKGWTFCGKQPIRFSERGTRLVYTTCPVPPSPAKEAPDDEKVSVDIWTWQDTRLQTQQLIDLQADKDRGYVAVYDLRSRRSRQLADPAASGVEISDKDDGRFALVTADVPYRREASWDPGRADVYLVDLDAGSRRLLYSKAKIEAQISPEGRYVATFDGQAWSIIDSASGRSVKPAIPYPTYDELNDMPDTAAPYGLAGWTKDDKSAVIMDRFDMWLVDPTGKLPPRNLTNTRGRQLRYRWVKLDPDDPYIDPTNALLEGLNDQTKAGGFYRLDSNGVHALVEGDKMFAASAQAKNADRLVFTRQDFVEYPDLWATDSRFKSPEKITDANPQQKDYWWGKEELVHWTSLDGAPLQGILIKPENFDYTKKYPLITYFYERLSDGLHSYHSPAPSASTINLPYFASNGYCIFIPDIPYRVGYPGYSALSAIVPGVQSIVSRGYIDPTKLGIQGQSWGGYQVAYLVTQTNMFAAAEAGAPVGDMFSAYGGIRYGSGVVREFQYEHGQSRIDGTPWDSTLRFVENSPVFFADKVHTPLMIMSNDQDGAVPHTQGIELFTALRRLDKPCWMVVYNGEDHNIMQRKNRKDFSVRLSQFFDHFLKGAPVPVWMSKGIPAVDKGRTMGLDLDGG